MARLPESGSSMGEFAGFGGPGAFRQAEFSAAERRERRERTQRWTASRVHPRLVDDLLMRVTTGSGRKARRVRPGAT
jgi:hypothetical protein